MLLSKKSALPIIALVLISGGLWLAGFFGKPFPGSGPPLYSYVLTAEGGADDFPELELKDARDVTIRKFELRTESAPGPVATLHVAQKPSGAPVLLDWRNNATEPVLRIWPPLADTRDVSAAISQHLPADAVLLGSWGTLRQLEFLDDTDVLFDENLSRPVIIPSVWSGKGNAIEALETEFWKIPPEPRTQPGFEAYVGALLMDEAAGIAKLRELAGGKEAYVVVHVYDAYMIGTMHPDRFAIGYRDFADGGKIHGTAKRVRTWIGENDYRDYTVTSVPGSDSTRAFFLADGRSKDTLIARLLPFTSSNPFGLEGMRVVYQRGGYWVFKLVADSSDS